MKAKYVYLTFLLAIGFSLGNCGFDDDCDCSGIDPFFDIMGMELSQVAADQDMSIEQLPENSNVSFGNYEGIALQFEVNYISQLQDRFNWNFSLINNALACSCIPDGHEGAKTESFKSLNVITLNDYDDDHLAGSSINDLLSISPEYEPMIEPLTDLLARNELIQYEHYFLKPGSQPTLNDTLKFQVDIELSNGELYSEEVYEVVIE